MINQTIIILNDEFVYPRARLSFNQFYVNRRRQLSRGHPSLRDVVAIDFVSTFATHRSIDIQIDLMFLLLRLATDTTRTLTSCHKQLSSQYATDVVIYERRAFVRLPTDAITIAGNTFGKQQQQHWFIHIKLKEKVLNFIFQNRDFRRSIQAKHSLREY